MGKKIVTWNKILLVLVLPGIGLIVTDQLSAQVVTTDLLFSADANDDTDPSDGWSYTPPSVTGATFHTLPLGAAGNDIPTRTVDANGQAFFSSTGSNMNFAGVIDSPQNIFDFSYEIWLRSNCGGSEDQIGSFRMNENFDGNFFSLTGSSHTDTPASNNLLDIDFRDRGICSAFTQNASDLFFVNSRLHQTP
jgi:hypothetical protein